MSISPELKLWATAAQARYIDAILEHGTQAAAARVLQINQRTIERGIAAVLRKSRADAEAPNDNAPGFEVRGVSTSYDQAGQVQARHVREAPVSPFDGGGIGESPARDGGDHYVVKGVSTYFDGEGQQRGQWVKTKLDDQRRADAARAAFAAMADELPRLNPVAAPAHSLPHLCNLYTMTDAHVGMLAWHKEGGANWDLKTAERELTGCFQQMIASSPAAATCVINQLGDWLHFDGLDAVTPTNRHLLDADARFQKVVVASLRILRSIVDMALRRHETVHIIMAEGNHDVASSVWLRVMFGALYENEPRVIVNDSALPYYMHRHGKTALWFHHGHLKKFEGLPGLIAAQFSVAWGETTKRYIHMGHCHHERVQEFPGVKVVQHPTLAARDAYAARHGYLSERQATAYTYHAEYGQVGAYTVTPEMLA